MTIKGFFSFKTNKYFWVNIIAMGVVVIGALYATLKGLDIYTRHGESVVVPDVKGMTTAEAAGMLRKQGLECIVSDSSFQKAKAAGVILELNPAAGQKVKEGRTVYLTVNALHTPLHVVPDVADNSSVRQAEARMLAAGFKLNPNQSVSGERDWVYGVKYQGRQLTTGEKVPAGATLTLLVGNGNAFSEQSDSTGLDGNAAEPDAGAEESASDTSDGDNWF